MFTSEFQQELENLRAELSDRQKVVFDLLMEQVTVVNGDNQRYRENFAELMGIKPDEVPQSGMALSEELHDNWLPKFQRQIGSDVDRAFDEAAGLHLEVNRYPDGSVDAQIYANGRRYVGDHIQHPAMAIRAALAAYKAETPNG